jgi:hypothetical protein
VRNCFFPAILCVLLPACSSLSKTECREMDWFRQGQTAASGGQTLRQAKTYFVGKCQEDHGVPINAVEFERGFKSGLNLICTPEGLESLAAKGVKYQDTCETFNPHSDREPSFEEKKLSKQIKDLEREILKLKNEISDLKTENSVLKTENDSLKEKSNGGPPPEPEDP